MFSSQWVCRSCLRALARSPLRQFTRNASNGTISHDLSPILLLRAKNLAAEHDLLQTSLETTFDTTKAKRAGELSPVAAALKAYEAAQSSISELTSLLSDPKQDPDLVPIAQDELEAEQAKLVSLSQALGQSLTPKHPFAHLPCMIEVRPGPGGLEGRYFADTLVKMYQNYCANMGYRCSTVKYEMSDAAGAQTSEDGESPLQEAILEISDPGSFNLFRTEAGMHRVQRIPSTEAKGRVHTSAVAVWVLPSFPDEGAGNEVDFDDPNSDFYIDPQEVKTETMRAKGAGGQHVNKTESAIRLTHIPTGTAVVMQDNRSQHRNRDDAWKLLRSRIADQRREAREQEVHNLRNSVLSKTQITRGDKIRTYNYNQDRCTDHRAGMDVRNLPGVLAGGDGLEKIMEAARAWDRGRQIEMVVAEEESKR